MTLEMQGTRKCRLCGTEKPLDDYYFRTDSNDHRSECKQCTQDAGRYRMYGVCSVKYHEMLVTQQGGCAICATKLLTGNRFTKLSVDHDHKTGKVRGLLCNNCNTAIGLMKESPIRLQQAIEYLKRFE